MVLSIVTDISSAFGVELFRKYLFPDLSTNDEENDLIEPSMPLLNQLTRQTLADAILALVMDDPTQYRDILIILSSLVPYAAIEDGMIRICRYV